MRFKVGDKVKVREWDDMEKEFGVDRDGDIHMPLWLFMSNMKEFCGNIYTINDVLSNGYKMDGTRGYVFTDDMLIPIEFGKSDLKTGMIVETKNGKRYMVYGARLLKNHCCLSLNGYDDRLNHSYNEKFDIVKCFDINTTCITCIEEIFKSANDDNILWQRKSEEKVISSDEAFKILKDHYGCDVKIKE